MLCTIVKILLVLGSLMMSGGVALAHYISSHKRIFEMGKDNVATSA